MLKARQRLGKYRIDGRIAKSGFANVYRATDIIEGRKVALKIPQWSGHTVTSWCIDRVCTRISSACPAGKSRLQPTFVVMQDLTP